MGLSKDAIPEFYNCEVCDPRPIDRKKAKKHQKEMKKKLAEAEAAKNVATGGGLTPSNLSLIHI